MMQSEIFRFLVARPVQRRRESDGLIRVNAAFVETLDADPARRRKAADAFVDSADFVDTLDRLTTRLAGLDRWLLANPSPSRDSLDPVISRIFGADAGQLARSEAFKKDANTLRDSLAAAALATTAPPTGDRIVRGLRLVALIEGMAGGSPDLAQPNGVAAALRAKVLLPPLRVKTSAATPAAPTVDETPATETPSTKDPRHTVQAIRELRNEYRAELATQRFAATPARAADTPAVEGAGQVRPQGRQRLVADLRRLLGAQLARRRTAASPASPVTTQSTVAAPRRVLSEAAIGRLSAQTTRLLTEMGVPLDRIDVPSTVRLLEGSHASRVSVLATPTFHPGDYPQGRPPRSTSVPTSAGAVRPAGVGDLQIVRQTLKRYDLGEVAHIENVLHGEQHERTFRRSRTNETFTLIEQEHAEVSERDLQSTERFEMQNEAKETIQEALSLQTGFQLSASYGPTVSVGVSAAGVYDHASEQSNQSSTDYAREIVERSSSRLTDRTLERRETRSVDETEDAARHGVDNSVDPAGHVVGVYRWVDKLYQAQVVNYGKRTLFEFVIPEPAAFYRFVQSDPSLPGGAAEAPMPPTVEGGGSSSPLSPTDIDEANYPDLVVLYGTEGIEPPPPVYLVGGVSLERAAGDRSRTTKTTELRVPAGYAALTADVTYTFGGAASRDFQLLVGDRMFVPDADPTFALDGEREAVPVALATRDTEALVATIQVQFERTSEHFAAWQLKTFGAIMAGYQKQKLAYDAAMDAAQVQAGIQIGGRNPAANQDLIRSELKKSTLTLLTAQHFDLFDAVRRQPDGSPQLDVDEAQLEGSYIQFFEQAFEWQNLTYVFYPYFWGRKQEWAAVSQRDDVDPLFGQFLRAGAARVQAPLRPGFEEAMSYFLEFGRPWNGVDPPLVDDELYVALAEEVRGQTGVSFVDGIGAVSVAQDSTELSGVATEFTEDDEDREIRVGGRDHLIASVESQTSITLAEPHRGADIAGAPFALGPKLVGLPWEVRVPTTLVMLQPDASLPSFEV